MSEAGSLASQHVLLVAEYYPSGGTRTYVRQLLEFYRTHGAHVTLVTTLESDDLEMQDLTTRYGFGFMTYSYAMGLAEQGAKGPVAAPDVWSHRRWIRERDAFRRLAGLVKADRVTVSAGTPGLLLGALAACPRGIYVLHTYPHGRRQRVLARPYLSRRIPFGTRLVSVSDYESRILEPLWRVRQRRSSVHTVLSTVGPLSTNESSITSPWTILTASLTEEYKRPFEWIDVAVEVSRRLTKDAVRFVWLGEGTLLEEARTAAHAVSDRADISFPGVSADPDPAYHSSRVYLQLSSIENMSLSVLDAQRHGLPSVVTSVGGLPEIVQDGVNGRVVPVGDVERAADAICMLLTDADTWDTLSAGARRTYGERHAPERWSDALLAVHA